MPIRDWSNVDAGLFHDFHQKWMVDLSDALNAGRLPSDHFALVEQIAGANVPDVLTLAEFDSGISQTGGIAVAQPKPQARFVMESDSNVYTGRASRLAVRHASGRVVAVIEIVSPGNKDSRQRFHQFVSNAHDLLSQGVHLLVVDLFPPSNRDPQGIHGAIWSEIQDDAFKLPVDKQLTAVAFDATVPITAYVEPLSVGDVLPELPIFLDRQRYVGVPLEQTYCERWARTPRQVREHVVRT